MKLDFIDIDTGKILMSKEEIEEYYIFSMHDIIMIENTTFRVVGKSKTANNYKIFLKE